MQCDGIKERLVELLYREKGSPAPDPALRAHVDSCLACRQELTELREVQAKLKLWQDEPPLREVRVPQSEPARERFPLALWRMARYAAFAALLLLAFLGLSNADLRWDSNGFSFKTSLLSKATPAAQPSANPVTQAELYETMLRAMADSRDYTFQMMQRVRSEQEQLWQTDLRYYTAKLKENRGKN
jgi:hypothetical protein